MGNLKQVVEAQVFPPPPLPPYKQYIYVQQQIMKKPPTTWATHLEQVWTQVPHLQTCDSCRLGHVSGFASTRFGLAVLPWGPPKPTNMAKHNLFKHD